MTPPTPAQLQAAADLLAAAGYSILEPEDARVLEPRADLYTNAIGEYCCSRCDGVQLRFIEWLPVTRDIAAFAGGVVRVPHNDEPMYWYESARGGCIDCANCTQRHRLPPGHRFSFDLDDPLADASSSDTVHAVTDTPATTNVYCIDAGAPASRECDPQIALRLVTPSKSKSPPATHRRQINGASLGRTPELRRVGERVTIEVGAGYNTGQGHRARRERAATSLRGTVTPDAIAIVELRCGSQDWRFGIAGVKLDD